MQYSLLRFHQIQQFLLSLRAELLIDAPRVVPFHLIVTNGIQTFRNQNQTREFYTMECEGGSETVQKIIGRVNRVLRLLLLRALPRGHIHGSIRRTGVRLVPELKLGDDALCG